MSENNKRNKNGVRKHEEPEDKKQPFAWPFSFYRITRIEEADELSSKASDCLLRASSKVGSQAERSLKRAAFHACKAADLYRAAGLGLSAERHWRMAAEVYGQIGDKSRQDLLNSLADNVPSQLQDDESF